MWTTVIAVAGTLLGTAMASVMQHLTAARTGRAGRDERRRQALVEAFPALLGALVDHRQHQYLKIVARREERPDTSEARQARYAARSGVTKAMAAVRMATRDPELLRLAHEAVGASFALGDAPTDDDVQTAGDRARETHDALQDAASVYVFDHR